MAITFNPVQRSIIRAWLVLLVALVPATALGLCALALGLQVSSHALTSNQFSVSALEAMGAFIATGMIYSIFLAPVFSILALPFLPFQRWIVRDRFPHLRPCYIGIVAYGPVLLILATRDWQLATFAAAAVAYEVIAVVATLLFARIAEPLGLTLQ